MLCVATPMPTSAYSIGYPEIFGFRGNNITIAGLDYNATAKLLVAILLPNPRSWFNIGLGYLEIAFNRTYPPILDQISAFYFNNITGAIEDSIDMLKNYTWLPNAVKMYEDGTSNNCSYFGMFVYLFSNRTIVNEGSMENYTMWGKYIFEEGHVPPNYNYTKWMNPLSYQASNFVLAQDTTAGVKAYIPLFDPNQLPVTTPEWVYGLSAGVLGGFGVLVVVLYFQRRKQ